MRFFKGPDRENIASFWILRVKLSGFWRAKVNFVLGLSGKRMISNSSCSEPFFRSRRSLIHKQKRRRIPTGLQRRRYSTQAVQISDSATRRYNGSGWPNNGAHPNIPDRDTLRPPQAHGAQQQQAREPQDRDLDGTRRTAHGEILGHSLEQRWRGRERLGPLQRQELQ